MKLAILIAAAMFTFPASSQTRSHARSMVITQRGIVATSQTLASQAGAQILARGGSAVDAAIAANAVLAVTEPMMDGPGGDLFVLYWDAKSKTYTGLNASGPAPKGLSIGYLKDKGLHSMPVSGIHSVTVPGAVEGWEKMHKRFGRLPWRELFRPAIYYASNGFPVTETIQAHWQDFRYQSPVRSSEYGSRIFLANDTAPSVGEVFRNPDLARTFHLIAEGGAASFYRGPIAKAILETSNRLGGTMTASDLANFHSEWVDSISTTYRSWMVRELPPNGQGIAALEMLNILEHFPMADYTPQSADGLHVAIEAMKLAYADLSHVGDERFGKIPVGGLLAKNYAKERAALVDMDRAKCDFVAGVPPQQGNTVYLAVVDREGNMASWIQSISGLWGSGVFVDGMGFALQNRGGNFDIDPASPNALAPGKRPRHTIIPAFLEKGDVRIAFGIMGGMNQPMAHAQFVSNIVDYGRNIQAALDAPRFTKQYTGGCDVMIESRVTPEARKALSDKGHQLTDMGDYATAMGRGQAVLRDAAKKVNYGASSPRGDGAAIPEPDPY